MERGAGGAAVMNKPRDVMVKHLEMCRSPAVAPGLGTEGTMRTSFNGGGCSWLWAWPGAGSCATAKEGKKDPAPKKTKTTAAMKKATPVKRPTGVQLGPSPLVGQGVLDKIEGSRPT
jgi:hypothetical protein